MNPRFSDKHDETDTCVGFHAVHIEQLNPGNTVIRCYGIEIFIIILSNSQKFGQSHVWLDIGLEYNNSCTFVDFKGTADRLNYIHALPAACTFTGCNYTPAFFKKSKKHAIKIMLEPDLFISCSIKWEKI